MAEAELITGTAEILTLMPRMVVVEYATDYIPKGSDKEDFTVEAISSIGLFDEKLYQEWLVTEAFTCAILAFNLYLTLAVCVYHYRYNTDCFQKRGPRTMKRFALDFLTTFACATSLARVFFDVDRIWGRSSTISHVYLKPVKFVLAFMTYSSIFLAFWMTQWMFYRSPGTNHLTTPVFRCISNMFAPAIIITAIGNIVLFLATSQPVSSPPNGCLFHYREKWEESKFYILGASSVIGHITLLVLLLLPLLKSRKHVTTDKNDVTMRLIRRVTASTSVALVGYLTTLLVVVLVPRDVDELSVFFFEICLTLMIVCLLFSFVDWRKRFFPFRPDSEATKPNSQKSETWSLPQRV